SADGGDARPVFQALDPYGPVLAGRSRESTATRIDRLPRSRDRPAPRRTGALDSGLASAARERHRLGNTAAEPAQREISRNTRGYARTHAKFRARARNSRERAAFRQNRRRFPDFTAVPGNLAADFPQPPPFTEN